MVLYIYVGYTVPKPLWNRGVRIFTVYEPLAVVQYSIWPTMGLKTTTMARQLVWPNFRIVGDAMCSTINASGLVMLHFRMCILYKTAVIEYLYVYSSLLYSRFILDLHE
jgi:hypothetical protein